jgi:hypothetical protein
MYIRHSYAGYFLRVRVPAHTVKQRPVDDLKVYANLNHFPGDT